MESQKALEHEACEHLGWGPDMEHPPSNWLIHAGPLSPVPASPRCPSWDSLHLEEPQRPNKTPEASLLEVRLCNLTFPSY